MITSGKSRATWSSLMSKRSGFRVVVGAVHSGSNCASQDQTGLSSVLSRQVKVVTDTYRCVSGLQLGSQGCDTLTKIVACPGNVLSPCCCFFPLPCSPGCLTLSCASPGLSSCPRSSACPASLLWIPQRSLPLQLRSASRSFYSKLLALLVEGIRGFLRSRVALLPLQLSLRGLRPLSWHPWWARYPYPPLMESSSLLAREWC